MMTSSSETLDLPFLIRPWNPAILIAWRGYRYMSVQSRKRYRAKGRLQLISEFTLSGQ